MADEKYNIVLNFTNNADENQAEIVKMYSTINEQQKKVLDQLKTINDKTKELGETAKKSEQGTKSLADGFKGIGLAIKSVGIGLIISGLEILKDLFLSNATTSNVLAVAVKSLNIIFSDLVNFFGKSQDSIGKYFKELFDNPKEKIIQFGKLIKDNLIERFNSFADTLGYISEGIKNLFTGEFSKAFDSFKKAAKESVDIYTGINNSVDRVTDAVTKYAKEVITTAQAQVNLENTAKLLEASSQRRAAQLENEAEKLRQLRDDTTKSIEDRIKANNKLKSVLNEQEQALLSAANAAIQVAQNNLSLNKSIDNQVALINARAKADQIAADIQGKRSEQEQNRSNLEKELITLNQTVIEGITKRTIAEQAFTTSLITDITDRLSAERAAIEAEKLIEEERLKIKRDSYTKGTQEYEDANQELLNAQQDYNNKLIKNAKDTNIQLQTENEARITRELTDNTTSFDTRRDLLDEQLAIINEKEYTSEEERTSAKRANTEARKQLDQAELDAKLATYDAIGSALGAFTSLVGEETAAGKALAVAKATIDTYAGISSVWGAPSPYPEPFGTVIKVASTAAIAASGFANVKKILSVKVPTTKGASGGGAGAVSASAPPSTTFVSSSNNQLAQSIGDQTQQQTQQLQAQPIKAYVTTKDITTGQELDRNAVDSTTIG